MKTYRVPNPPLFLPNTMYLNLKKWPAAPGTFEVNICISENGYDGWFTYAVNKPPTGFALFETRSHDDRNTGTSAIFIRLTELGTTGRNIYKDAYLSFNNRLSNGILAAASDMAMMTAFLDYLNSLGMTLASGAALVQQAKTQALAPQHYNATPANVVDAKPGVVVLA
ncbi:hypothetical protein CALVIDRAFT_565794 [Calocera viscosa TUFC12733]|uniref:Uncharacterized protein n=1 Tax=Calocera viscosa (strain TUFC12733) TaxID=1330018 RepID=A0A167K0V7_CALVF|nr:hypothetical protein CALVIDRAFT_565794 [Calocera viscosa TUFC12733]